MPIFKTMFEVTIRESLFYISGFVSLFLGPLCNFCGIYQACAKGVIRIWFQKNLSSMLDFTMSLRFVLLLHERRFFSGKTSLNQSIFKMSKITPIRCEIGQNLNDSYMYCVEYRFPLLFYEKPYQTCKLLNCNTYPSSRDHK